MFVELASIIKGFTRYNNHTNTVGKTKEQRFSEYIAYQKMIIQTMENVLENNNIDISSLECDNEDKKAIEKAVKYLLTIEKGRLAATA